MALFIFIILMVVGGWLTHKYYDNPKDWRFPLGLATFMIFGVLAMTRLVVFTIL